MLGAVKRPLRVDFNRIAPTFGGATTARKSALLTLVTVILFSQGLSAADTPTATGSSGDKAEGAPGQSAPGQLAREQADEAESRAKQASSAKKTLVAARLTDLAQLWRRVAEEETKAAALEKAASELERETLELESKARRAASLLEQTEARRARAAARLSQLGLETPLHKESADLKKDEKPVSPAKKPEEKQ